MKNNNLVIKCKGHINIVAAHKKTFEIVREKDLSVKGDCIIGVNAQYNIKDLLKLKGSVIIKLKSGNHIDEIEAFINPLFNMDDPFIVRKAPYPQKNTFAFGANKAAFDLSRNLIDNLKNPDNILELELQEISSEISYNEQILYILPIINIEQSDINLKIIRTIDNCNVVLCDNKKKAMNLFSEYIKDKLLLNYVKILDTEKDYLNKIFKKNNRIALLISIQNEKNLEIIKNILIKAEELNIQVMPVPVPDFLNSVLYASGILEEPFKIYGFLNSGKKKRNVQLNTLIASPVNIVLFIQMDNISNVFKELQDISKDSQICLGIQSLYEYEQYYSGTVSEIINNMATAKPIKYGRAILVLKKNSEKTGSKNDIVPLIQNLLNQGVTSRTLVESMQKAYGWSKKDAYSFVLDVKDNK